MIIRKIAIPLLGALFILVAPSLVADAGRNATGDLVTAQDQTRNIADRLDAILAMGRSGDVGHSELLLRMLRDKGENRKIRAGALIGLAELAKPMPEIIEACEEVYRDPEAGENLRYTILLCLGMLKAASSTLVAEALSDGDDRIRFKAAQAMGMIGGDDAVNLLASRLDQERDRIVRAEIVRALGLRENAFVEGVLAHSLKTDPAAVVRYNAALSLVKFRSLGPDGQEALRTALADPSLMVRGIARRAGR